MKDILRYLGTWKFWKELIIMTVGMTIAAAAVYYFMMPGKLVLGSISGLSIVIANVLGLAGITVKVSWVVTAINAILLLLAWLLIDSEFGAKTVYTAMILGPLLDFWAWVCPYEKLIEPGLNSVMGDPLLDLIVFVLVVSISQTILFSINASTGGLDILAKIVNKYLHFDIGVSVTVAGAIICCTAFAINPFRMVVIGLVGTWMNGLALDYFMASVNRRKRICIVSDQSEQIRSYIVDTLSRGCTIYDVRGGYKGDPHTEIQSLLTTDEFSSVMNYIKAHDIKAFITAGNVSEVYGLWNHRKNKKIEK
ncbi:MAG: YitT family protein [Bacteroidales bacterium]|nr:YitT family protein [Bacteroidales bacterium]MBQ7709800.1 YitT family protein [Bacteroidales bacterium]